MTKIISFATAILMIAGLTACGGGSVSSGGGGAGGGTRASSSLVVQVDDNRRAAAFQQERAGERSLATIISELLVRNAIAQTAGVTIYVDGEAAGTTDADGQAVIPLDAGTYEVCVVDPTVPEYCTTVSVAPDSVVVVSDVDVTEDTDGTVTVSYGAITTESAEENIAAFEDPNNPVKTIICHETGAGQFTLSVGTPAVIDGHLGHGDSLGPCPGDTADDIGGPPQSEDGEGPGRPEGAGPPENAGPPEGVPGNGGNDNEEA